MRSTSLQKVRRKPIYLLFYWAIITVSTVGYGDVSAHTTLGKLLSILMALGGVGMFGVLTSSITSYFQEENEALQEEVAEMKLQLNRIEKLLIQQKEQ
ncbi:potassium channel family protein [Weissella cibaria]|uniref:potassium channel family protein n=1 Tax=Weissella cibaria TaxID=137591 RepID=UPI003B50C6EC